MVFTLSICPAIGALSRMSSAHLIRTYYLKSVVITLIQLRKDLCFCQHGNQVSGIKSEASAVLICVLINRSICELL